MTLKMPQDLEANRQWIQQLANYCKLFNLDGCAIELSYIIPKAKLSKADIACIKRNHKRLKAQLDEALKDLSSQG